jgi:hypothetical protein
MLVMNMDTNIMPNMTYQLVVNVYQPGNTILLKQYERRSTFTYQVEAKSCDVAYWRDNTIKKEIF